MAIEASKFTEKDELIAKFYTLRAGLSAIAEETEKIKAAEKALVDLNAQNEENNQQVQANYVLESKYYKDEIDKYEHPNARNPSASYLVSSRINNYQAELNRVAEHKASFAKALVPGIITFFAIVFVIAVIVTVEVPPIMPLLGLSAYVLPFVVGSLCRKNATKKEQETMSAPIRKKIQDGQKELEQCKIVEEKALLQLHKELESLKSSMLAKTDIYKPDIDQFETKLNMEIIPACTTVAQSVRNAMLEISNGIITESDWANLDLLVFYLETGRADSLKEALQLVDKQRQTEQIIYAIHDASNHIVNTLGVNLNRLGTIIDKGFNRLSNQIQFNHNESMNTMLNSFTNLEHSINAGNREMNERLSSINASIKTEGERVANAENINAALLRKANESSDQLMHELRYNQKYWHV